MHKVGLLFVHGIGEQERFEHLRRSVGELAEIVKGEGKRRVTVTDRTKGWKRAPDAPEFGPYATAPMTVHLYDQADPDPVVQIDCHEVWWGDLGARTTLSETIGFWWWGLGQWAAPIYRELDPTGMRESRQVRSTTQPQETTADTPLAGEPPEPEILMPRGGGKFVEDFWVRARLAAAAFATILSVFSWTLLGKLVGMIARVPFASLLVQYIGDVRVYERRAYPNTGLPSDPGQPLRVPIRRRMVAQMVAMGTHHYAHWGVAAHSLGSVLAYNGLTETGHALPNYLTAKSWAELPGYYKDDPTQRRRKPEKMHRMMPARPTWLADEDCISRRKIFAGLRCFFTYGSPLDKFAAIWPRIVATPDDQAPLPAPGGTAETDHKPRRAFPPECRWINLYSDNDPVAGKLDAYQAEGLDEILPDLKNVGTRWDFHVGISHLRYLLSRERADSEAKRVVQRRAIANWLIDGEGSGDIPGHAETGTFWFATAQFLGAGALLLLLTGMVAAFAGGVLTWLGIESPVPTDRWNGWLPVLAIISGLALGALTLAGLSRWRREAALNWDLARSDTKPRLTIAFLATQSIVSALLFTLAAPTLAVAALANLGFLDQTLFAALPPGATLLLAFILFGMALVAHSAITMIFTKISIRRVEKREAAAKAGSR